MDTKPQISLAVPGRSEYAIVLRQALGGVALLEDLSVDGLDDLRMAADEACDCLLHQRWAAERLLLEVWSGEEALTIALTAELGDREGPDCEDRTAISKAVLETLMPRVQIQTAPCGCIGRIEMSMPRERA